MKALALAEQFWHSGYQSYVGNRNSKSWYGINKYTMAGMVRKTRDYNHGQMHYTNLDNKQNTHHLVTPGAVVLVSQLLPATDQVLLFRRVIHNISKVCVLVFTFSGEGRSSICMK